MKKFLVLSVLAVAAGLIALGSAPAQAAPATLYVDDNDPTCSGNAPCYAHPQDAVNAANPGDTILVYPGTYNQRYYATPVPPHWGNGDRYAPALIVWKDGLTIQAIDPTPNTTVIQTLYDFWVNKDLGGGGGGGSIEHSTGCVWNAVAKTWDGTCVRPKFGTPPNAVAIIASNVTLDGFTMHRPISTPNVGYNAAGVMIGGLYAGQGGVSGETLGFNNNTVKNCTFSDVWHAVYIWHSSGNQITDNTVAALGNTGHWAGISMYDGYDAAQIGWGNLSTNNVIDGNTLADKGISVGAWGPTVPTDNSGTQIVGNTVQGDIMLAYSASSGVEVSGNTLPGPNAGRIIFGGQYPCTSCVVSGNTVGAGTGNGIQLSNMTGGSVSENDVSSRTANGIALLLSSDVEIVGNTAHDNGASGIVVAQNSTRIDVSGNEILRNAGNADNKGGLTIKGGASLTTVVNNTINENTQYGVWIKSDAGSDNVFHCNSIVANASGVGMWNDTLLVNAEENFWGDATGPVPPNNVTSGSVDYTPWAWMLPGVCPGPQTGGVGGTTELRSASDSPQREASGSGPSSLPYAALVGGAAAALALTAGAWYARRRWVR